jgi:hypothetical protein
MQACGACHDNVNFATGANHAGGGQTSNANCVFCHTSSGIQAAHLGAKRRTEGALYAGGANGFGIDNLSFASSSDTLTIDYHVTRSGSKMLLESAPQWTPTDGASALALKVGWNTAPDYTNEESGSNPAQPISVNALNVGGCSDRPRRRQLPRGRDAAGRGLGERRRLARGASRRRSGRERNLLGPDRGQERRLVLQRGHGPGDGHDPAARRGGRQPMPGLPRRGRQRPERARQQPHRHDAGVRDLSQPDATDVNRRPAPPAMTADGKKEETIDFKRLVHMIHSGADLEKPLVVYGFNGSVNDFSHVHFIGNRQNCETCHVPGSYSTEKAFAALPTTIDTAADRSDSTDDLNISPTASVCSSCHDSEAALTHMKLHGASFHALDADIN